MKEITLTNGMVTLVDDVDFEWLNQFSWRMDMDGYAVRTVRRKTILMHREIAQTPQGMLTDHKNLITLDNRRHNLRHCTPSQNQHNKPAYKNNSTGFKGVSPHRQTGRFQVHIGVSGKRICVGLFATKEEAHVAYCNAAKSFHGEFART